jgi:hypothetical protein
MEFTFTFTKDETEVLVKGLDTLLKTHGLAAAEAVFVVNSKLQQQAKAQIEEIQKDGT